MSTETTQPAAPEARQDRPPEFPGLHFDVPVAQVFLSPFYQRVETQDPRFIKWLDDNFDPRLFGEIKCSHRPPGPGQPSATEEMYACIDGGHRLAVAVRRGYEVLPAEVLFDLTERQEAELCLATNKQRKNFGLYDRWVVERNLRNPDVLAIERVLAEHDLHVAPTRGPHKNKPRGVHAVGALRQAYAKTSDEALSRALESVMRAWGPRQLRGDFIKALAHFFERYPDLDPADVADTLRNTGSDELTTRLRQAGRSGGGVQSERALQTVRALYNEGRDPQERLRR